MKENIMTNKFIGIYNKNYNKSSKNMTISQQLEDIRRTLDDLSFHLGELKVENLQTRIPKLFS
jgi:hypothetical protein